MPWWIKNESRIWFLNFVPLSLLILRTIFFKLTMIILIKSIITCALSQIGRRKYTQVKHENSSTMTNIYFFLPIDLIVNDPHISICRSSRGWTIFDSMTIGCPCNCCLPCSQVTHKELFSNLSTCKTRKKSFKTSLLAFLKFKCERLRCQSQQRSKEAFDSKQIDGKPTMGFMSNVNISPFCLEFNNTLFVILLEITLPCSSKNTWYPFPTTN